MQKLVLLAVCLIASAYSQTSTDDVCGSSSPCGEDAICIKGITKKGIEKPLCMCPKNYEGDPYSKCKEISCHTNKDCLDDEVCIQYECENPCKGGEVCGENTICTMKNHFPICTCKESYYGDPFILCTQAVV